VRGGRTKIFCCGLPELSGRASNPRSELKTIGSFSGNLERADRFLRFDSGGLD